MYLSGSLSSSESAETVHISEERRAVILFMIFTLKLQLATLHYDIMIIHILEQSEFIYGMVWLIINSFIDF